MKSGIRRFGRDGRRAGLVWHSGSPIGDRKGESGNLAFAAAAGFAGGYLRREVLPAFCRWSRQSALLLTVLGCLVLETQGAHRADEGSDETAAAGEAEAGGELLVVGWDSETADQIRYQMTMQGTLTSPAETGQQDWNVQSTGNFVFVQQRLSSELSGPLSIRGARLFSEAQVEIRVGEEHRTTQQLSAASREIHVHGSDSGVLSLHPNRLLSRQETDLLQLSGDPLVVNALLPSDPVEEGATWEPSDWVLPALCGIEAVIEQNAKCALRSLSESSAVVEVTGTCRGATAGAACRVGYAGVFELDRTGARIRSYRDEQKQRREIGAVNPGLDVTVKTQWTRQPAEEVPEFEPVAESLPGEDRLTLEYSTPWQIGFRHSRDWYVFHETAQLAMLRLVRNGALLAQCNMSPQPAVPPGESPVASAFRADVANAVGQAGGQLVSDKITKTEAGWRQHRIQATGLVNEQKITWDYYFFTSPGGLQCSFVFSHMDQDRPALGDGVQQLLGTLTEVTRRPALPY